MATKDYLDKAGVTALWARIGTFFVRKESGKGLSSNDFSDSLATKLDGIAEGANKYTHPGHTAKPSGLYKVTVDASGHVSAVETVTKLDITGLGIPGQDTNTTYVVATADADGLMSAANFEKLDGIAEGANKYTHPTSAGNKHIPTGGSAGKILLWSASGTAVWGDASIPDSVKNAIISTCEGYADSKIAELGAVMKYKGQVATVSALPTSNATGDTWNVQSTGANYAWNGTSWDKLSETIDLSDYVLATDLVAISTAEINTICV